MPTRSRKVAPHLGFECAIKSFHDGRFELGFDSEEANVFMIKQALHVSVIEFSALVRLQSLRLPSLCKDALECMFHFFARLVFDGCSHAYLLNRSMTVSKYR